MSVNIDAPKVGTMFQVESVEDGFGYQKIVLKEVEAVEQITASDGAVHCPHGLEKIHCVECSPVVMLTPRA